MRNPSPWIPALFVLVLASLLAGITIARAGGDALALVRIGTRFSQGEPGGAEGYDGQFVYYIALDPTPKRVATRLDVPAYRYQRILLPMLARLLSFGNPTALPWVLPLIGILSLACGAWAVGLLMTGWGVNSWYSLVYGLYVGFLLAVIVDLPEPLAYGLVAGGFIALERKHMLLGWVLLGLSAFAKEVTLIFIIAVILAYALQRQWRPALGLCLVGVLPFALFQGWLWLIFGSPGLGSGGAMATPFEWIPFMGLLRIGPESMLYLAAMLLVFGPAVIFPSLWGIWKSARFVLAGEKNMVVLGLLLNALVIPFTPFSTFRETGGILRLACGLVLALLLFASRFHQRRALNYSTLWLVLNVFLLKS